MSRIVISGTRTWDDEQPIRKVIYSLPEYSTLIVGDATGADEIAEKVAHERGDILVKRYKADWKQHGNRAGRIRNAELYDQQPEKLYAFQIDKSRGTAHSILLAQARGIPIELYTIEKGVKSWE